MHQLQHEIGDSIMLWFETQRANMDAENYL